MNVGFFMLGASLPVLACMLMGILADIIVRRTLAEWNNKREIDALSLVMRTYGLFATSVSMLVSGLIVDTTLIVFNISVILMMIIADPAKYLLGIIVFSFNTGLCIYTLKSERKRFKRTRDSIAQIYEGKVDEVTIEV